MKSDLFSQLRGQARLESRGEFTLDIEQAAHKMSRFQLPQPQDFLPHLAAGLFRLGATSLSVKEQKGRLCLSMPALQLPPLFLQELPERLFAEKSGDRRLAAAVQSLLAYPLTLFRWIGRQSNQSFDYLSKKAESWGNDLTEIHIEGLPAQLLKAAQEELRKKGGWSRKPLQVGSRRFQWPFEATSSLGGLPGQCEWEPGESSGLRLVMDEILCEVLKVETPFAWTGLCYGEFALDASLARVLEDEQLACIQADIPSTFTQCIRAKLHRADPKEVFPLLRQPLPNWLQPLETDLLQLELFRDQHGRHCSLAELRSTQETIYYAAGGELKQLEPVILVNPSRSALECLQDHLGGRLQKADRLILRQLQRQHNQRLWQAQSAQQLSLSQRHWLYQAEFQREEVRWLVGVPDDWSQMGATLVLWVGGRKLAVCQLLMQEICCEIACEIPPALVNELWTGISDSAWSQLEPAWNESLRQLLNSLSEGQPTQVELRASLKKHLASQARPQDSYFRKTLLFQDWKGQCYSLDQLLKLPAEQTLGVVGPQFRPDLFPEKVIPQGVFLRNSGPELSLLVKLGFPEPVILDYFLEDLMVARQSAFGETEIIPQPGFGVATFWFCVDGIRLRPFTQEHAFSFLARVCCQGLKIQALTNNKHLGTERFGLVLDDQARPLLERMKVGYLSRLQARLRVQLPREWLEWMQEATLRGLCREFLREVACWPRYPQGLVSLQELSLADQVHWCSGPPDPTAEPVELLLPELAPNVQTVLMRAAGGAHWICLDETFARSQRQRELLASAPWSPPAWGIVAELKPALWLLPRGEGRLYWLYQGRLLKEEPDLVPYGFHLARACSQLEPPKDVNVEQLRQECFSSLREFLAVPRPTLWEHWEAWRTQGLPDEIEALLRNQGWFETNRGPMSWQELMAQPEVWLFSRASPCIPQGMLVLYHEHLAPLLVGQHPCGHSLEETTQRLRAEEELAERMRQRQKRSQILDQYRHHQTLNFGKVALSGSGDKDLWWLGADSTLLVDNVPPGLTGFVTCEVLTPDLKSGDKVAELGPAERGQLMQVVAELLRQRLAEAPLLAVELELVCQVCAEREELRGLRWIECSDGTYTSLHQLCQLPGDLHYWTRKYFFQTGGPGLLPILSTPLLVELVARVCQKQPLLEPPPPLHREVSWKGFRSALSALARVVCRSSSPSLLSGMRQLSAPSHETAPAGRVLLDCLQRRAAQLLQGEAQEILLQHLREARLVPGRQPIWEIRQGLLLHQDHPQIRPWLGQQEPPLPVQTSLLLSLVCAINATSLPFTDQMESEFLGHLADQVLQSRPQ